MEPEGLKDMQRGVETQPAITYSVQRTSIQVLQIPCWRHGWGFIRAEDYQDQNRRMGCSPPPFQKHGWWLGRR